MNTKDKFLVLFCTILFFSFIAAGSAMAEKHYLYLNNEKFEYTLDSTSKITNPELDAEGIIQNGTIERGILANKSYFNAKIINYQASEFIILDEQSDAIDLVPLAERINSWLINPVFWIFMGFLFALAFRAYFYLMHEPWIKTRNNEDLRMKNIGRLSQEKPLNNSNLWEYTFKTANGIIKYYSDRSFSEYAPFLFEKFMGIIHYYPELVVMVIDVPKDSGIQNYEFKQTTKNKILKIFYAICIGLSLIKWSIWLFEKMEKSDDPVNKIKFITSLFLMEHLDLRFKINYEKLELNQETGIEAWIEKQAENITLAECIAIQKNPQKVRNFGYVDVNQEYKRFRTAEECFRDLRSRIFDRSYFESKKLFYERQVERTYQLYQQIAEELTTMKLTEEERFHQMYSKIEAVNTERNYILPELISKFTKYREMDGNEKQALQKTMTDLWETRYGEDAKKISQENAELKAQISLYQTMFKEKLQKLENNEIVINRVENKPEDEKK